MNAAGNMHSGSHTPSELSVVVPAGTRHAKVQQLLARCDQQTLAPRGFEVIVVDDGSPSPLVADPSAHRFALTLLRQEHAGPGAARNLALQHCRGKLVLFLDDDALPAFDLFEKHVEVHATRMDKVAVLGTFDFTSEALRHPFVQVLNDSDLLYDYLRVRDGALHPWQYFWTCNISLPLAALREAGGFDARTFPEGLVEDLDLGLRLAKQGYSVLFRKDLACEHDHVITVDEYFARAERLGVNLARLSAKHGRDPLFARGLDPGAQADALAQAYDAPMQDFLEKMRLMESGANPGVLAPPLLSQLRSMAKRLALVPLGRGRQMELAGIDQEPDHPAALPRTSATDTLSEKQ